MGPHNPQTHNYLAVEYNAAVQSQRLCRRFHAGEENRGVNGVFTSAPGYSSSTEAATDVDLRNCTARPKHLFEVRVFYIRTELIRKFGQGMKKLAAGWTLTLPT